MSIATENELIDRLAECIRFYGCERDDDAGEYDEQLQYAYGHSGEGWYLGSASYPDEGAEFIGPDEYGALLVAQAIVAEERAAVAATSPTEIEQRRGARSLGGSSAETSEYTPRPQRAVSAVTSPVRADAYLLQEYAPVSFVAQLMALGDSTFVAESCSALDSQPVMLFTADVDEVRKAGALFHRTVRLTAEGGGA